jgi:hypothetical protein
VEEERQGNRKKARDQNNRSRSEERQKQGRKRNEQLISYRFQSPGLLWPRRRRPTYRGF